MNDFSYHPFSQNQITMNWSTYTVHEFIHPSSILDEIIISSFFLKKRMQLDLNVQLCTYTTYQWRKRKSINPIKAAFSESLRTSYFVICNMICCTLESVHSFGDILPQRFLLFWLGSYLFNSSSKACKLIWKTHNCRL